ncbi:MAG: pilus assembly protein PilM [Chitinivibrionales bacterium]|nr:pilus assembly protein PilM [Chitinivibrionales bacterium]
MAKHKCIISGIDINRSNICYAQFLIDERRIANIGIQPLDKDIRDFSVAVKEGLDTLSRKFVLPKEHIVISLPAEYAIIKKIILDTTETDLNSTVRWELSQQILSPLDEFSFDFQPVTTNSTAATNQYQSFLVVAYRNSSIAAFTKPLKARKVTPAIIDLDIFALINVYEANYSQQLQEPAFILYSEGDQSKIILTCSGGFVDYEVVEHGKNISSIDEYAQYVKEALRRLQRCNSSYGPFNSVKIYFCGSFFSPPETIEAIKKQMEPHHAEILQPFRGIGCSPEMNQQQLSEYALHLAVSVGLALRGSKETA